MSTEKISAIDYPVIVKEPKLSSDVYQIECRKGSADNYHANEKRRAREQKKWKSGAFIFQRPLWKSGKKQKEQKRVLMFV